MNTNSVVITGASGFVGSNLAEYLTRLNFEVHLILRKSSDTSNIKNIINKVTIHYYDGSLESISKILEASNAKVVFHLASLFIAEHKRDDVGLLIQSNILFGSQLVEAMKIAKIKHLINTGTTWQHFNSNEYNPVNLYASTKQAFEDILKFYSSAYEINILNLKLPDTYGSNDSRKKIIRLLINSAFNREPLLLSPGDQELDLLNIKDVVKAFVRAHEILVQNESLGFFSYGITSGNPISLKELVRKIEAVIGLEIPITWGGREYRVREVMHVWKPTPVLPNWMPEVSLEDGIKDFLNKN
jgi:nucleoside-diphosphate-sugar epimerase